MILCGSKLFSIADKNDPAARFMCSFYTDHIELFFWDYDEFSGLTCFGISLDAAESIYGSAQWVCPD